MILAPHALAGAATAVILQKYPATGVAAAFLSHFILDAIPHWHYKLSSLVNDPDVPFGSRFVFDRRFLKDIFKTGFDFGIGLAIALTISGIFFPNYFWLAFFGAVAGVLPDFLQLIYHLFPDSPLFYLQWFHVTIHAKKNLDNEPLLDVAYQISFSLAVILALFFTRSLF